MARTAIAVLVFLLFGCVDSFAPTGARRIAVTAQYRVWWTGVAACAQKTGNIDRVNFWVAPSLGDRYVGRWVSPHDIYFVEGYENDGDLVKHEMLHDLLQTGAHPKPPFGVCAP